MNRLVLKQLLAYIHEIVDANKGYAHLWQTHVLWTWQWWIQLLFTIMPIVIWIVLRNRDSTDRLLYAGFFVIIIASWMDFIGNSFGLWYYPFKLVPSLPPFLPWETSITVEVMLFLQYKSAVSPWIKAIVMGLINSFVFEPLAVWMGLYVPVHWRHIYSLPIYILMYLLAHCLVKRKAFKRLDEA